MESIDVKKINENEIIESQTLDHKLQNNNLFEFNKDNIEEIKDYEETSEDENNQNENN